MKILAVFVILWLSGILTYTFWLWKRWAALKRALRKSSATNAGVFPKISVVIPARNEADNIVRCLQGVANQDYRYYEIIIVDDHSTDKTAQIAHWFKEQYPQKNIHVLSLLAESFGKKNALTAGIQAAVGEWVVTTDADCFHPAGWLSALASYMQPDIALLVGPIRIEASQSFFEKAQALESAALVVLGGSLIESKKPIFANGANFSFQKTIFHQVGGYKEIDHIASGDDELLLHRFFKAGLPVRFCWDKQAIVSTFSEKKLSQWWQQRIRWVSKSSHYRRPDITLIQMAAWLSHSGILVGGIVGLIYPKALALVLTAWVVMLIPDYLIVSTATRFLGNNYLLTNWLPAKFVYVLYVFLIGIFGNLGRKYQWKGRRVH